MKRTLASISLSLSLQMGLNIVYPLTYATGGYGAHKQNPNPINEKEVNSLQISEEYINEHVENVLEVWKESFDVFFEQNIDNASDDISKIKKDILSKLKKQFIIDCDGKYNFESKIPMLYQMTQGIISLISEDNRIYNKAIGNLQNQFESFCGNNSFLSDKHILPSWNCITNQMFKYAFKNNLFKSFQFSGQDSLVKEIISALIDDDIETFKKIYEKPTKTENLEQVWSEGVLATYLSQEEDSTKKPIIFYELTELFDEEDCGDFPIKLYSSGNQNIFDLSARFGAIKIFKFLYLMGFAVTKETVKCAAEGGCTFIVHTVENKISPDSLQDSYKSAVISAIQHGNIQIGAYFFNKIIKPIQDTGFLKLLLEVSYKTQNIFLINALFSTPLFKKIYLSNHFLNFNINCSDIKEIVNCENFDLFNYLMSKGLIIPKSLFKNAMKTNNQHIIQHMLTSLILKNKKAVNSLNKNYMINKKNENEDTLLHIAIRNQDENAVILLLSLNADINLINKSGYTPIMLALESENKNIIKLLLEKGMNTNVDIEKLFAYLQDIKNNKFIQVSDAKNYTKNYFINYIFLSFAIITKNHEVIKNIFKLNHNIIYANNSNNSNNINSKKIEDIVITRLIFIHFDLDTFKGLFPEASNDILTKDADLMISDAIRQKDLNKVKYLISKTSCDFKDLEKKAIKTGNFEIWNYLSKSSNSKLGIGTAFYYSIYEGNVKLINDFILNYSFLKNGITQDPQIFVSAIFQNNFDIAKIIFENGANIDNYNIYNILDNQGSEPISSVTKDLIKKEMIPLIGSKYFLRRNRSFLYHAVEDASFTGKWEFFDIMTIFLKNGYDMKIKKGWEKIFRNSEAMKLVLGSIDESDIVRYSKDNWLHWLVLKSDLDQLKVLLKYNINVNEINENGETPLYLAVNNNDIQKAKFLLEHNANPNILSTNSNELKGDYKKKVVSCKLPLSAAINNNNMKMIELLIKYADQNSLKLFIKQASLKQIKEIFKFNKELNVLSCLDNDQDENPIINSLIIKGEFEKAIYLLLSHNYNIDESCKNKLGDNPLHFAVEKENLELIRILIEEYKFNPNTSNLDGVSPLMISKYSNNPRVVEFFGEDTSAKNLDDNVNNNLVNWFAKNSTGNKLSNVFKSVHKVETLRQSDENSLFYAAQANNVEKTKILLDFGIDPKNNSEGLSPLYWAVKNGNVELINLLTGCNNKDIVAKFQSKTGQDAPWAMAAHLKDDTITKILLPFIDNYDFIYCESTPLHFFVEHSTYDQLKILLESGKVKKINTKRTKDSLTPLHLAVYMNDMDKVRLLLNFGANINRTNNDDQTPLNYALSKGYFDMAKLLLNRGANSNIPDINGDYPIHFAVQGQDIILTSLLLQKGALNNVSNKSGKTPSMIASQLESEHIKNLINVEPVKLSSNSMANIVYNLEINDLETVLNSGIDVNQQDEKGKTLLFYAAKTKSLDLIKLLLQKGANPNIKDNMGNTPLHVALLYYEKSEKYSEEWEDEEEEEWEDDDEKLDDYDKESEDIVKALIDKGAKIDILNNNGICPLWSIFLYRHIFSENKIKLCLEALGNISENSPLVCSSDKKDIFLENNFFDSTIVSLINYCIIKNRESYVKLIIKYIPKDSPVVRLIQENGFLLHKVVEKFKKEYLEANNSKEVYLEICRKDFINQLSVVLMFDINKNQKNKSNLTAWEMFLNIDKDNMSDMPFFNDVKKLICPNTK